jgi:enolase
VGTRGGVRTDFPLKIDVFGGLNMPTRIRMIKGREVLDSRGVPTLQVDCWLGDGSFGRAAIPSGASTGSHEALELRDGGERFFGKGVQRAVSNVNEFIAKALIGMDVFEQEDVDNTLIELDGTEKKTRLGANAILGASLAVLRAAANAAGLPLYRYLGGNEGRVVPVPMVNIINGGAHSNNPLDVQEFMIVPAGVPSFREGIRACAEVFFALKSFLKEKGFSIAVGDEGGFSPDLNTTEEALDFLVLSIEDAGYEPGKDIYLALDVAATGLQRKSGVYFMERRRRTSKELVEHYMDCWEKYPLISLEDGLAEDDWEGWIYLTEKMGDKIQIVGDDIFVTDMGRIKQGVKDKAANAVLIKPNQIGTVTETLQAIRFAKENGFTTVISHRSGETEDTSIADLAVATNAGQIKSGSLSRSERIAKYNRLLVIEEELGDKAIWLGTGAMNPRAKE